MGKPKLLLDWGNKTVIEQVIENYLDAGFDQCVIVSGKFHNDIQRLASQYDIPVVYNKDFGNGEMTTSLQVGIKHLPPDSQAVMVALGDQPFLKTATIQEIHTAFTKKPSMILMPSIHQRRGHPWIIQRDLFQEILDISPPATLRDFIKNHEKDIQYKVVKDPAILLDMDTPEDYEKLRP